MLQFNLNCNNMRKQKKIQIRFVKNTKKRIMSVDEGSLKLYSEMMGGRWYGKI